MAGVKRKHLVPAGLALLLSLNACGTDEQATQGGGTALGVLLGSVIGYAITGDEKGALLGAGIGGLGGFAVGNEISKRKQQYSDMEDMLDGEIQNTEVTNATLTLANRQLRQDLSARQRQVASLENAARRGNLSMQEKQTELASLRERQTKAQQLLSSTQKELEVQTVLLGESESTGSDDEQVQVYRARVEELQARVQELHGLVEQYAQVDDRISNI